LGAVAIGALGTLAGWVLLKTHRNLQTPASRQAS
jgi:hypothetical protein